MKLLIKDTDDVKIIKSNNFNLFFNKKNGFTATWGRTKDEDPDYCPGGPIIADIEIATSCKGVGKVCDFCYKKNNPNGEYMTFDTFKILFAKLPPTLTQIAVGIGDIDSNPDMWKIFDYCRKNKVIPNVTVNGAGITDEIADKLVENCGAVAVSVYDKELSFNTIKKLTDAFLRKKVIIRKKKRKK